MREYLFRGRRLDSKEWVDGLLTIMWGQYHILNPKDENTAYPVDPETVGQFTGGVEFGLEGAEKRKIFDGDIVQVLSGYGGKGVFLVVWNYESARWYWKHLRGTRMFYGNEAFGMKILGNRWDNPELLEGTS